MVMDSGARMWTAAQPAGLPQSRGDCRAFLRYFLPWGLWSETSPSFLPRRPHSPLSNSPLVWAGTCRGRKSSSQKATTPRPQSAAVFRPPLLWAW